MKFIAIIGALLVQAALSQDTTDFRNSREAKIINNVVRQGKADLADKLSHLSPQQLQKFKELRQAQKNFKASLKSSN